MCRRLLYDIYTCHLDATINDVIVRDLMVNKSGIVQYLWLEHLLDHEICSTQG